MAVFGLGLVTTLAIGLDTLSGVCELDEGLDGAAHLTEAFSASASENKEIWCMMTRPTYRYAVGKRAGITPKS